MVIFGTLLKDVGMFPFQSVSGESSGLSYHCLAVVGMIFQVHTQLNDVRVWVFFPYSAQNAAFFHLA